MEDICFCTFVIEITCMNLWWPLGWVVSRSRKILSIINAYDERTITTSTNLLLRIHANSNSIFQQLQLGFSRCNLKLCNEHSLKNEIKNVYNSDWNTNVIKGKAHIQTNLFEILHESNSIASPAIRLPAAAIFKY